MKLLTILILTVSLIYAAPTPSNLGKRAGWFSWLKRGARRTTDNAAVARVDDNAAEAAVGTTDNAAVARVDDNAAAAIDSPSASIDSSLEEVHQPDLQPIPREIVFTRSHGAPIAPYPSLDLLSEMDDLLASKNYAGASDLLKSAPKGEFSRQAYEELISTSIRKGDSQLLIEVINSNPLRSVLEELNIMKLVRETESAQKGSTLSKRIANNLGNTRESKYYNLYFGLNQPIQYAENLAKKFALEARTKAESNIWLEIKQDLTDYGRITQQISWPDARMKRNTENRMAPSNSVGSTAGSLKSTESDAAVASLDSAPKALERQGATSQVIQPQSQYYAKLNKALDSKNFRMASVALAKADQFSPEAYKYVVGIAIKKGDEKFLTLALSKQVRSVDDDLMLMSFARTTHPGEQGEIFSTVIAKNMSPANRISAQDRALEKAARSGDDRWIEIAGDIAATD